MRAKIQRWGNSLAIRLPKALADEARLGEGSEVEIEHRSGMLVVRPARRRSYALGTLFRRVRKSSLHSSESTGNPVGRERL